MDYKNNIKELSGVFTKIFANKTSKWTEFREFHKFIIENVDAELCRKIGSISDICRKNNSYSMQFTAKDYLWWGMLDPKDCDLYSVAKLKKKVYDKIVRMVDNLGDEDISMEIAEELLEKLK
jgi:hypothetical protein